MDSDDSNLDASANTAHQPEARSTPEAKIDYVRDVHTRVDDIGAGKRWYDLPYKVMWSLQRSWFGKRLPRSVRAKFNSLTSYFFVFYQNDINKQWSRDDPLHNFYVPADEHVYIPGIWVIELFPPSEFSRLTASIERNSWDKQRVWSGTGEANLDMLNRSRTGAGGAWWRLAEIVSPDAPYTLVDGLRRDLPYEFQAVELLALQVGTGLTAVLAYFHLRDACAKGVDIVWHTDHEPQIVYGKGLPKPQSRQFVAYRRTQDARRSLHDTARRWLASNCPGVFAHNNEPPPSMDLILLDKCDPSATEINPEMRDALRALGLTEYEVLRRTSAELPGLLLEPPGWDALIPGMRGEPTWALWGQREAVARHFDQELPMYGGGTDGLTNAVDRRIRTFLVLIAVSHILGMMNKKLATLRDDARSHHGHFSARDLNELRRTFLTLSMDVISIRRDLDDLDLYTRQYEGDAEFEYSYAPNISKSLEEQTGERIPDPVNMNNQFKKKQISGFDLLVATDKDYREVLSTVASLGASVSASRLGRAAVVIAIGTLVVAVVALLIAKIDPHAPLVSFGRWTWSLIK